MMSVKRSSAWAMLCVADEPHLTVSAVHTAKGSCQDKCAIWGVEAPAWQGARKSNSRSI